MSKKHFTQKPVDEYRDLHVGAVCPKCELGKGLRASSAIELGLTGWESYMFLHCGICGAFYAGKESLYMFLNVEPVRVD